MDVLKSTPAGPSGSRCQPGAGGLLACGHHGGRSRQAPWDSFDDLPAPEPAPARRHHPWEPPEAEFPGIVPIDTLLLGRTDQVAVAVTGLSAFSAGIAVFVTARIRPSAVPPE